MKKDRKRLSLRAETIRSLSQAQLANAAGGIIKTDADSACSFTNQQCQTSYCNSDPCGTVYCAMTQFCV